MQHISFSSILLGGSIMFFILDIKRVHSSHNLEVTAGAFWRPLPQTVSYEATIPLVYQSNWHEKSEMKNNIIQQIGTCKGKTDQTSYRCRAIEHLNLLQNAFNIEFQSLSKSWSPIYLRNCSGNDKRHILDKRSLDFLGDALNWCCGVATENKLEGMILNENTLKEKMFNIKKGLTKSIRAISENSIKFKQYEKSVAMSFRTTEKHIHDLEGFIDNLKNDINSEENEQNQILNSLLNNEFQSLKNIIQVGRAIKRQGILASCRQHQIPIAILDPSILLHDLSNLLKELQNSNQTLAISINDISKYYQLPICDCTFTDDNIFIHVRIPISQQFHSWELYQLVTTPFAWHNQTCKIIHDTVFLAVSNFKQSIQLRQISGTGLQHCKPFHDKLCYLPRFSADSIRGPACAKQLFTGATVEEINHHCPLTCHKSSTTVISEIEDEIYIITHPKKTTSIQCPNSITRFPDLAYNTPGAIKAHIPCNCKLSMNNEEIIPKRYPCIETLPQTAIISHIIPAAWSNLKSFIINPVTKTNLPTFGNISECLNTNWTVNIPYINLTSSQESMHDILETLEEKTAWSYSDTYGMHGDSIFIIWNSILSICVVFILFRNHPNLALLPALPRAQADRENNTHHDVLFSLLCTAFLIFLSYLCYKLIVKFFSSHKEPKTITESPVPAERTGKLEEQGNRFVLELSENPSSLSKGKSVSCTLHKYEDSDSN
ncbi:uncharacterized protein [Leptinotarsa decemlineata]|uniref:uncharacterized protein n=1 Tax=Leptinotarsa decemlineata TaxID=7539 RepID=UPI003D30ABA9